MATDLSSEKATYRRLAAAARRITPGRNDRPVHVSTLTRWITDGVRLSDGSRLRLEARRLPGRWVVSDEAIEAFLTRLTADRLGQPAPTPARASASRRRDDERTEKALDAIGV